MFRLVFAIFREKRESISIQEYVSNDLNHTKCTKERNGSYNTADIHG